LDLGVDLFTLVMLSVGLAMDAFSVATVTGFSLGRVRLQDAAKMSLSFGAAHVVMPTIGWYLGATVVDFISGFDHWLAFLLLAFVGGKMMKEGLNGDGKMDPQSVLGGLSLLVFTLAVSVDSLAVGLSFSLEKIAIFVPSLFMGAGTLAFTFVGLMIGNRTGQAVGRRAQILGGLVLILIGARIVLSHMV